MENVVAVIVVCLFMSYMYEVSKKKAEYDIDGNFVLRMGILYSALGWFLIILSIIIFIFAPREGSGLASILFIFLMFFGGGCLFVLISKIKIVVTQEKIIYYGLFNKTITINWIDIDSVVFNELSQELILKSDTSKIKLEPFLIGINDFKECMKEKLNPSLYEDALEKFSKYTGK